MFLIGEFSKISRVSKRLLHHYDDIGLFKPEQINHETGYRYYSIRQLPRLNRILALKDLGLSLDQITKLVSAHVSNEEIHGMLMLRKAEMEQILQRDLQRLRGIEARLLQNQTAEEPLDIVLKSVPEQPFLSHRTVLSNPEESMQLVGQMFQSLPSQVGEGVLGPLGCVAYSDSFSLLDNEVDLGFFLRKKVDAPIHLTDGRVFSTQVLPPVKTMATSVQTGGPDPILVAFGKIGRWIEENGYQMAGPYRELGFEWAGLENLENMMVEIQVPVQKAESLLG